MKKSLSIILSLALIFMGIIHTYAQGYDGQLILNNISRQGDMVTIEGEAPDEHGPLSLYSTQKIEESDVAYYLYEDSSYKVGQEVSREEILDTDKFPAIHYTLKAYNKEDFSFEFHGKARDYEYLSLSVYNSKTGEFQEVDYERDRGEGVRLQAFGKTNSYIEEGQDLVFRVNYKLEDNYSNKIYWITDTQYYTMAANKDRRVYEQMAQYGVDLYKRGDIGYILHTGDVVDLPTLDSQFKVADRAQSIIDVAGVPNGVLAGNHDVGWGDSYDYYNFRKYFGRDRYDSHYWYGEESKGDNSLNYQLVTLGGRDFIFLNIGFGVGDKPEAINWANEILAKYRHRTAVVSTHAYLDPQGNYVSDNAKTIFERIVAPNSNVLLVLNGHYDAACKKILNVNGRQVVEILADYQSLDPARYGGEGYTRTIEFSKDKLINRTYSPITGSTNHYDKDDENFELSFPLLANQRSLSGRGYSFLKADLLDQMESPFSFKIQGDGNNFVLEGEKGEALISLKDEAYQLEEDKNISRGKLPMLIQDPAETEVGVDNINFHLGKGPGQLKLSYTSHKSVVPKITFYKKGVQVPFTGTGAYHLDRFQNKIDIENLEAGETYKYDLHGVHGEITIPGKKPTAKVAVLADPQIGDQNAEYKAITEKIVHKNYDLVTILGDLTDNGMDKRSFDLLLNARESNSLYQRSPLAVVKGNHDAPNFFQRIATPKVNLDDQYSYVIGNMRFINLNTDLFDSVSMIRQGNFLLKESKAAKENKEFVIVKMHKGIYTSGSHIDDLDVVSLRKYYSKLFEKAGVDLVLQGHDHVYSRARLNQRGQKDPNGVTYLSAGHAGGLKWYNFTDYEVKEADPILGNYEFLDFSSNGKDFHRTPMYVELENIENTLKVRAFSLAGEEETLVDEFELLR